MYALHSDKEEIYNGKTDDLSLRVTSKKTDDSDKRGRKHNYIPVSPL